MADKEYPDIVIQGSTATWDINMTGNIGGLYTGTFRFRVYLTPTQRLAASRTYREMLGTNPSLVSDHDDNLAFALAQLKYRVVDQPPFWSSTVQGSSFAGDLADDDVIMAVLDAAIGAELKYKAQVKKKREDAIEKAKNAVEAGLKRQQEEASSEDKSTEDTD